MARPEVREPGGASDAPSPNAASAVVLRRDGRVLLVQRGHPPNEGVWTLPGGRIEPGETAAAAAAREVYEETGIEIDVVSRVGDVTIGAFVIAVHAAVPVHDEDGALDAACPADDARAVCWASEEALATLGVPEATRAAIADASSRVPPAADPHASSRVPPAADPHASSRVPPAADPHARTVGGRRGD